MPLRLLEVVLAERGRLVANITGHRDLARLALAMLLGSVLFALPYGAVLSPSSFWNIATLFVGSMVICFTSSWFSPDPASIDPGGLGGTRL